MTGQFQVDLNACSTTKENCEATLRLDPSQPGRGSQFTDEIQKLLGDNSEPDPLFFAEIWSLGLLTALGNWYQRQHSQVDTGCKGDAVQHIDNVGNLVFASRSEWNMQNFLSAHAEVIARCHDASSSRQSPEDSVADAGNQPLRERELLSAQRGSSDTTIFPMTDQCACIVLGVTEVSTRIQVRDAYRHLVGLWHPDRLERESQEVRRRANEQMTAINEAYRLLLIGLTEGPRTVESA